MAQLSLLDEIVDITGEVLKNTAGVYREAEKELKARFSRLEKAFGRAAVRDDYRAWAEEQRAEGAVPKWPIPQYVKVADVRLGAGEVETVAVAAPVDMTDPKIGDLGAFTYELTGVLPSANHLSKLLNLYDLQEIKDALTEYAGDLSEREIKGGVKSFFAEAGAIAVITARRNREKKA